ncbi:MAG: hypothetical protein HOV81_02100 [Kofleriaceae bacterium]|nr:hypothetical protein [Kofleriaceae bacterium]
MRWLLVLLLCGCNQIYGLKETGQQDAAFFDAPADAPYACPAIGVTPQFSPQLTQFLVQRCEAYSVVRSGRAVARCKDDNGTDRVFVGNIDERLEPAIGVDMIGPVLPRLTQDGEHLIVREPTKIAVVQVHVYDRQSDGTWLRGGDPPFGSHIRAIGTLSDDNRMLVTTSDDVLLHEWIFEGTTWRQVGTQMPSVPSVSDVLFAASLTEDGLRVVATVNNRALYSDRATVSDPFRAFVALEGAPRGVDMTLNADCSRLYAAGLGSVFYANPR